MPSIESLGHPLAFPLARRPEADAPGAGDAAAPSDRIEVVAEVRALEGMQKEAVVTVGGGRAWRMVSDEGPYLNGTDLAPFPLAFFTAGTELALLDDLLRTAGERAVEIGAVSLGQDNRYTMEGSFLRGDAVGGALAPDVAVSLEADAGAGTLAELVRAALAASPGEALLRAPLRNTFTLTHNGRPRSLDGRLPECVGERPEPPRFEGVAPDRARPAPPDAIEKVRAAEAVHGVEGGAGSSLRAEQKRTLHVRGDARLTAGGLLECDVTLFKPLGSAFRLRSAATPEAAGAVPRPAGGDPRGRDRPDGCAAPRGHGALGGGLAPTPIAYLAAAVGFCFLTQLGRYAHIVGRPLDSYALVQRSAFRLERSAADGTLTAGAEPVDTHVFLESDGSDEAARDFVVTGARTCFLHAALRDERRTRVRLVANGETVDR